MSYAFQFDYGVEGVTLYAFIRPLGQTTIWSTVAGAFVAYSAGDWANYDIAMTEQSGSGTYFGTWPDVVTAGFYDFTVYQRLGGSPASSDTLVGTTGGTPLYYTPGSTPVPTDVVFAGVWYAHAATESDLEANALYKRAGDTTLTFAMDCNGLPEVRAGQVLTAASVAPVSGLTVGTVDFDDSTAFATFSGGTAGTSYDVVFLMTLSGGSVYERTGVLAATAN